MSKLLYTFGIAASSSLLTLIIREIYIAYKGRQYLFLKDHGLYLPNNTAYLSFGTDTSYSGEVFAHLCDNKYFTVIKKSQLDDIKKKGSFEFPHKLRFIDQLKNYNDKDDIIVEAILSNKSHVFIESSNDVFFDKITFKEHIKKPNIGDYFFTYLKEARWLGFRT